MNQQKICTICDIPIQENYCSRCGQKASEEPITTISLITDFLSNFFSIERSGFATIFKIILNPKPIVDNYYSGFKNYYASPGKILLYGIAVVALHISFVNNKVMGVSLNLQNFNSQYFFWISLLPILLFISYLAFIRKTKRLSKHLISLIYISSSLFIILTILNDLIILLTDDKLGIWAFVIFVVLIFLWNSRVFTDKKNYLYIILNTVIQLTIFMGIVGILMLISNQLNSG